MYFVYLRNCGIASTVLSVAPGIRCFKCSAWHTMCGIARHIVAATCGARFDAGRRADKMPTLRGDNKKQNKKIVEARTGGATRIDDSKPLPQRIVTINAINVKNNTVIRNILIYAGTV